ncbi:uncharacterized protein LOC123384769 isoform X3 [Felis catus]|uniref:uncharacterized protein LOC123384769 isoform X3 n=1 Tax=Felis catus TaxID=9685 RepID=UPI001D19D4C5|nr:uncharacterized protein LOC123384769 isoform X3 [Felis catus]
MPHCHAHSRLSQRSVRFIVPGQGSSTGWSLRLLVQEEGSWAVTRLSQGLVWRLLVKSLSCYLTESPLMKMEMSDTSSSRPRLILELGSVPTLSSFLLNEDEVHRVPSKYDQMLDEKADDGSFLEEVCKPQHTPCVQRPPSGAIGTLIHTNPVSRSPQHFEKRHGWGPMACPEDRGCMQAGGTVNMYGSVPPDDCAVTSCPPAFQIRTSDTSLPLTTS